jgi:hypothetical protein
MQVAMVHEWHDFYVVAGGAAAALLGLLFVALTPNADLILTGNRTHLKRIAEQAFQNYAVVLISALLFAMPHRSWDLLLRVAEMRHVRGVSDGSA